MALNQDQIILLVRKIILRRLFLKVHIIVFLVINALLFFLNNAGDFNFSNYQWWPWATTGWAVFLAFHMYFFFYRGMKSLFQVHLFTFIIINTYIIFIDWYSGNGIKWAWIPLLAWSTFLIIHGSLKHEITQTQRKIDIIGVLISDDTGRVLIDAELSHDELAKRLSMPAEKIEMIPMFVNAIQSFSEEINIRGANDFQLFGTNLKVLSVKKGGLTMTGFLSAKSEPIVAKVLFDSILTDFSIRFAKELEIVPKTGNTDHFTSYRQVLIQKIKGDIATQI